MLDDNYQMMLFNVLYLTYKQSITWITKTETEEPEWVVGLNEKLLLIKYSFLTLYKTSA